MRKDTAFCLAAVAAVAATAESASHKARDEPTGPFANIAVYDYFNWCSDQTIHNEDSSSFPLKTCVQGPSVAAGKAFDTGYFYYDTDESGGLKLYNCANDACSTCDLGAAVVVNECTSVLGETQKVYTLASVGDTALYNVAKGNSMVVAVEAAAAPPTETTAAPVETTAPPPAASASASPAPVPVPVPPPSSPAASPSAMASAAPSPAPVASAAASPVPVESAAASPAPLESAAASPVASAAASPVASAAASPVASAAASPVASAAPAASAAPVASPVASETTAHAETSAADHAAEESHGEGGDAHGAAVPPENPEWPTSDHLAFNLVGTLIIAALIAAGGFGVIVLLRRSALRRDEPEPDEAPSMFLGESEMYFSDK